MRDPGPILIDSLDKPNASPQGPGQPHPHTPISRRDEPRTRLPAQAWLIITAAALLPVLLLLWAAYSAVQALLFDLPWIGSAFGLLLLVVAATSLLALGYSLVMWLFYRTQRSRIIRSRFDVPIDSMMVLNADPIAAEAAHLAYETAKIAAMEHPLITTWTSPQQSQPKVEAPALLAAPAIGLTPDSEWLPWLSEAPHILIAGSTNSGKTTMARIALRDALERGANGLVIDPKGKDWYGLPVVGSGRQFASILSALDSVRQELDTRYQAYGSGERAFTPLIVVVDEVPDIMDSCRNEKGTVSDPRWSLFARSLGSLAREVQIRVVLMTQSPNVEEIGMSGGMRANYTRLALREKIPLLLNEDVDPSRREVLRKLYSGQKHPAAIIRHGQVHLLDTSRVVELSNLPYQGQGWYPPSQPCQPPTKESATRKALANLKARGFSRDYAREVAGLQFTNDVWGEV
jgi:hypothetical protein